jgi:hypothetical protein
LVIAVVGLALSVASIVWQAAQYLLTGGRVRLELLRGAMGRGLITTNRPDRWDGGAMAAQGFTAEILAVRVRNVGRLPVVVEGVSVAIDGGTKVGQTSQGASPNLPHRLEGGSSELFFLPFNLVKQAALATIAMRKRGEASIGARMVVELGDGRAKYTRGSVRVP